MFSGVTGRPFTVVPTARYLRTVKTQKNVDSRFDHDVIPVFNVTILKYHRRATTGLSEPATPPTFY